MQGQQQATHSKYLINLSMAISADHDLPLKNHPQVPYLLDMLGRKEQHHVLLRGPSSPKIQTAFLNSMAMHINVGNVPKKLLGAYVVYFDARRIRTTSENSIGITNSLLNLCKEVASQNKLIILIINDASVLQDQNESNTIGQLLRSRLFDEQWRLMVLAENHQHTDYFNNEFSLLRLNEPTDNEVLAVIKSYRKEIEKFHNIIIAEDAFQYALSLAKHYLGGKSHLDKAIELLDSAAARASMLEQKEPSTQPFKPILSTMILAHVVANWTRIPLSHLHHNKFKLNKFLNIMQQKIYGQDTAINVIGSLLQSTCIKFKEKASPVFSLLLTGPSGVGKKEFAFALAEHLFSSQEALLHVSLNKYSSVSSLSDVLTIIRCEKTQRVPLLEAIQLKPYAVVLLENFNELSAEIMDLFNDIFMHGYTIDKQGNLYDFRHTIIIITTTLGSENITQMMKRNTDSGPSHIMDLMQLVLNENTNYTGTHQYLSPQEVREHILPALKTHFPAEVLRHIHVVPFVPIDAITIEKIIKAKLKLLAASLEEEFNIELSCAAEVVKFLTQEALKNQNNAESIRKIFEQYVNSSIANEILARIDDKTRPKRLALLLNHSGQLLRCEFIHTNETSVYAI